MAPALESSEIAAAAPNLSSLNGTKASIAPPKVSANGTMELENMGSEEVKLPLHEDIMQLARFGEIEPIKKLFQDGKFKANYQDEEGITPLHVCTKTLPFALLATLELTPVQLVGSDQQPLRTLQVSD